MTILKNRYSGEQQADKYRSELQIRRRRDRETLSELHQDIRRLMALAYPRLTTDAREEIACDHFINALDDPEFALKVKERAPRLLDEALNVALRLEAWAKSINRPRQSDERLERSRQKVRVTAKPNASDIPVRPDFDDRMTQLEATMSQLQTNLQRLSEKATPATNVTVTSRAPVGIPLGRRQNTQTTVSAREVPHPFSRQWGNSKQPVHPNIPPLISSSSSQPFLCWKCGLPEVNTSIPTDYPSAFQGPIQIVGRVEGDETTDTFACPSRSALRSIDMLTGANKSQGHKVPWTVAATPICSFIHSNAPSLTLTRGVQRCRRSQL